MTDKAIDWVRQQKALMADKPLFVYFTTGATPRPHHAPKEWSDKYRDRFDQGWDRLREETFARQKELRVIPQDAELTARPAEIPAWDDMAAELKPILARRMEIYAGFLEHTDHRLFLLEAAKYNVFPLDDRRVERFNAGEHQVRMEVAYDGGGLAKGGTVSLYVDGAKVGEGRVDATPTDDRLG
jgi:hypothetical protein